MNNGSYFGFSAAVDLCVLGVGVNNESVHVAVLTQLTRSGERIGSSQVLLIFPGQPEGKVICFKKYHNFNALQA
jgi:hypothetical protein